MTFLDRCRVMLEFDEGYRAFPYLCTAGVLTVGVGHALPAHRHTPEQVALYKVRGVSRELAGKWLDEDIDSALTEAVKTVGAVRWDAYGDVRRAGLVNWHFQLGPAGVRSFKKSLDALRESDWPLCAARMKSSKWYLTDTPARAERVIAAVCFEEWAGGYRSTTPGE